MDPVHKRHVHEKIAANLEYASNFCHYEFGLTGMFQNVRQYDRLEMAIAQSDERLVDILHNVKVRVGMK